MQKLLDKLFANQALTRAESHAFFSEVVKGNISNEQLAAALIALKLQGETVEEIAGAATAALENAAPFPKPDYAFADIVGTGVMGITPSIFPLPQPWSQRQWAIKLPNTATVVCRAKQAQVMF